MTSQPGADTVDITSTAHTWTNDGRILQYSVQLRIISLHLKPKGQQSQSKALYLEEVRRHAHLKLMCSRQAAAARSMQCASSTVGSGLAAVQAAEQELRCVARHADVRYEGSRLRGQSLYRLPLCRIDEQLLPQLQWGPGHLRLTGPSTGRRASDELCHARMRHGTERKPGTRQSQHAVLRSMSVASSTVWRLREGISQKCSMHVLAPCLGQS